MTEALDRRSFNCALPEYPNGYPEFCRRVTPGSSSRKLSELVAPHLRCFEPMALLSESYVHFDTTVAQRAETLNTYWGNAPGFVQYQTLSAESAIHSGADLCGINTTRVLDRAFSACS